MGLKTPWYIACFSSLRTEDVELTRYMGFHLFKQRQGQFLDIRQCGYELFLIRAAAA